MRFKGFIGPSYISQSVNVDCQRCVNLYPEVDQLGTGKDGEVASLISSPGLTLLCTLPSGPVRGIWNSSSGTLYAVGGAFLYSISNTWVATPLGELNTSLGPVSMCDNGLQLVVVDGEYGYSYTFATPTVPAVFADIVDVNFLGATLSTYIDTYFVFNEPATPTVYNSVQNSLAFSGLAVANKEGWPDNVVGVLAVQENLYVFGTESIEIWYDAGTTPTPFARIQGAMIQAGCSAPFTIAHLQNNVLWLGGDDTGFGIVYLMNGYQPQRISTPCIETLIRSAGFVNVQNARAWTYQQMGHIFYCLNVPSLNSTWVYDLSTNLWHERAYLGNYGLQRHLVDCQAVAYGVNVGGDYQSGNIYQIDPLNYTDNGTQIQRLRASPHVSNNMSRIFHTSFQLDIETGVGLSGSGQGTAPQAILQWSNDGGHTWSNEHWTSIGAIGHTLARAIWRRLGQSRSRVYRVIISDPVKVTLIGADVEVEAGSA